MENWWTLISTRCNYSPILEPHNVIPGKGTNMYLPGRAPGLVQTKGQQSFNRFLESYIFKDKH